MILFKSVTDTKFEPTQVTFLRLMPHAGALELKDRFAWWASLAHS